MTTDIIPVNPQDIHELTALVNSAYRGDSSKRGWTTEADLLGGIRIDEAALAEMTEKPEAVILKALNGNKKIVGCVYLEKRQARLYLGMLTVSPDMQGEGIGKQLLKAAEEYALQHECHILTLTVISVRTELIQWYERHGYKPTGETESFPDDPRFGIPKQPLHFIVMDKQTDAFT